MTAPLRVVLADDEPPARAVLRDLLRVRANVELCAEATDGEATVEAIRTLRPDLVFLDIQMPDLDGFEVLHRIAPAPLPRVVFVTAYDEFAVRAFEVHALDYLVKPFTDARFDLAFARACAHAQAGPPRGDPRDGARILQELGAGDAGLAVAPPGHFMVRVGRRTVLVGIDEVDWIEADRYYATLHVQRRTHLVRETMGSLEARLDPAWFVRIHRSAIVNLRRVRELRRGADAQLEVVLHDGTTLEVSRSRRRQLALRLSGQR
jgi:two-component system LytT family response regulator